MAIRFNRKRNRLHVGYRAADWSNVWMEQRANHEDDDSQTGNIDDGETDYDLYKLSTGGRARREPRPDEVKWHQHFDPKNCDATTAAGRNKLQKRFLHDAFQYLTAKSAPQARAMERDMDRPREARWQSWFDIAKKFKRQQMPELRQPNDPGDDDDDSALGSDEDDQGGDDGPMPPPRGPNNPRRRPAPGSGSQNKRSKKTKVERDMQQTRLSFLGGFDQHTMSGGLGSHSDRSASASRNVVNDFDNNNNEIFDPSPPEGVENTINGNYLNNIGSPSGQRHRGNSRDDSLRLFNGTDGNGNANDNHEGPPRSVRDDVENVRRLEEVNGDMDEDEAFDEAIRQSVPPSRPQSPT